MSAVIVLSRKWNGDFHRRTPTVELGSDQFGTWLGIPPGTIVEVPNGSFAATPGVRLIPHDSLWSAYFTPAHPDSGRPEQLYVDITTHTTRRGDVVEFVDLDLDVERWGQGPVVVLDRDEFEANAAIWSYPPELIAAAEETCEAVFLALTRRTAPFNGSHHTWLTRLTGIGERPSAAPDDAKEHR